MNNQICPICRTILNTSKIKKHFNKVHPEVDLLEEDFHINADSAKEYTIVKSELDRISNDYLSFELKFMALKKVDYFEKIENDYNLLYDDVDDYLDITSEEMKMEDNILVQIMSYKCRVIREMKEKLNQLKVDLPAYNQYLNTQYQTVYVTWSDLTFDKNKIRISANKAFVKAIEIPERKINLKALKIDCFRNHHPEAIFKLIVYKGVIMEERSKGVAQILDCLEMCSPRVRRKRKEY